MTKKGIKKGLSVLCITALSLGILAGCQNSSGSKANNTSTQKINSSPSQNLNLNMKKGEKYKVVVTNTETLNETINNQPTSMNQVLKTGYLYDITDVASDGTATLTIKFDTLTVNTTSGGTTYEFDSSKAKDEKDPQALAYGSLIGQAFTVKLDKNGHVKEVSGADTIFKNMTAALKSLDQSTSDQLVTSLKQVFGDDALKQTLESMTNIYPEGKQVAVGDSWQTTENITSTFPLVLNNNWIMKDDKDDVVTLDMNSTVTVDNSAKPIDLNGVQVKYVLSGTEKGTIKLTKSNGFIQSGETDQNITGNMVIGATKDVPNPLSVPVNFQGTTTFEVTKQ